ncbi:ATP-binding protein [Pseudoalteromonas sp. L21]|uniref:AAA family ATPase n=1 Tax=Pseudoalteromonas sp. L21 TaxID=1539746 RepID=UPI0017E90EF4|nr:ATP-binding protein [Pseudoalteromonas sp. L21]MCF7516795.1 ATP-binding protein [Pseudoalteromonas sp. L21]QWV06400.1 ATP-binding protein [Pseudoalteromonas shioyasakiensis]HIC76882.1 ATP-binding protein [Candidatus Dadabacteria bacterium]
MEVKANLISKIGKSTEESWVLEGVRQMTFFIGPNNSGKSRELRSLFKDNYSNWVFDLEILPVSELSKQISQYLRSNNSTGFDLFGFMNKGKLSDFLKENLSKVNDINGLIADSYKGSLYNPTRSSSVDESGFYKAMLNLIQNISNAEQIEDLISLYKPSNWSKIYIPTLRGLRHVAELDIFEQRTKLDYFSNMNQNECEVFTGHNLYKDLTEHLLGSFDKRQKVRDYENYLSENFFFGRDISLVPMLDKHVVYVKEGDDEDRPIYDLGDGIQSIILLTYKVFMAEKPTIFFIEEPEHFLHAGLQRTLIETFAKHKEHLFFMTTHSNHFLDLVQERDDISIQQVSRVNGESIVQASLDYGELLNELGVRASSVLLANCSIWVEGVTDKLYLRAYLNKYIEELEDEDKKSKLKSYHENLHFVFTEYQGSNITHWDFSDDVENDGNETPAKRLNRNILLIADADIEGKGERVESLRKALSEAFYLLEYKEIENYIPFDILIDTAKARWDTFKLRTGSNIDRFENMKEELFKSNKYGIGEVLERYVDKADGLERKFYSDKSGTIKDKVKFCHTAISLMNESDDWKLTPELTSLCETVWDFIESHNQ